MGQPQTSFPVATPGTQQDQLYIRGIEFLNYHINHDKWDWWRLYDIIGGHKWEDDFCQSLDDGVRWDVAVIEIGQGSATYTCTNEVNGVLLLTNAAGDNDYIEVAQLCECWKLVDNFPLYAEMRVKISDATQSDFWFGLVIAQTFFTPPNDFVVFKKDDGDANIDFANQVNGAGNDTDTTIDFEDDTWLRLGFHWDGDGTIRWFIFRDVDEYCLATGVVTTSIVQDEELTLGFGIRNGEAVAKTCSIDYIKCSQKRVIE